MKKITHYLCIDNEISFYFKALLVIFILTIGVGIVAGMQDPENATMAMSEFVKQFSFIENLNLGEIFLLIFFNNTILSFLAMLLGTFYGIIPVLFIIFNGLGIGIAAFVFASTLGIPTLIMGILPHGVFEIWGVLLAASYGVFLGERFHKTMKDKAPFKNYFLFTLRGFLKTALPLLLLAAFIETFITSQIINSFSL